MVLLLYIGLLVFVIGPAVESSGGPSQVSPWEVERISDVRERLLHYGHHVLVEVARFAPLGFFAVLAMPRQDRWVERFTRVFVPGAIMASLVASFVVAIALGWPGLRDLILPCLGCLLGGWIGMSARRGVGPLLLFFPKLAVVGVLVGACGLAVAYFATERQPLDLPRPAVSSEQKRELVRRFRRANPAHLRPGDRHELALSADELDALLGWGFQTVGLTPRTRLETGTERVLVRASVRLPGIDRYLNVSSGLATSVHEGELDWSVKELNVGPIRVPSFLLGPLSALCETALQHDRVLRPVWAGIRELELSEGGLSVSYGPMNLKGDALDTLLKRLGPDDAVLEAARAQLAHLASSAETLAGSEDRFAASMETAFGLARERTLTGGDPVVESSGAILALATVLGHPRLRVFAGLDPEEEMILSARRGIREVTLRGRADWTKHFFVSAGLTQLSSVSISDAAGVLKEELDADTVRGGSGFSFADLLADRAGTLFARTATLDAAHAAAMQDRIANGFRVDEFFPSAEGLAEGIPDPELQSRYGGVGGAEYARVVAMIETRLATCAAYR